MFPLTDENADAEPRAIRASFADPYILLFRDNSSVMVLGADESGDLDEIALCETLQENQWLSGSLYDDANDTFCLEIQDDEEEEFGNVLMFLLSVAGGLYVSNLQCVYRNQILYPACR